MIVRHETGEFLVLLRRNGSWVVVPRIGHFSKNRIELGKLETGLADLGTYSG